MEMSTTAKISKISKNERRNCFIERILIQLNLMFNINFPGRKTTEGESRMSIDGNEIRLVLGLGNPGDKYKNTYHNVGLMFVNHLTDSPVEHENNKNLKWKNLKSFRYASAPPLIIVKSSLFMNESGRAAQDAASYFKIEPKNILVVHDDSDISLGEYKISFGRGSAGHNGIESVIQKLGTNNFQRLRIGIRNANKKAGDFVLNKIPEDEMSKIRESFSKIQRIYFES